MVVARLHAAGWLNCSVRTQLTEIVTISQPFCQPLQQAGVYAGFLAGAILPSRNFDYSAQAIVARQTYATQAVMDCSVPNGCQLAAHGHKPECPGW